LDVSHEEMRQRHRELAEQFGNQPSRVVGAVEHERAYHLEHEREPADVAQQAVTFARDRNMEREAVVEERAILRDASSVRSARGASMTSRRRSIVGSSGANSSTCSTNQARRDDHSRRRP
jgi:hypothetical protein